jgi:hypothetical protein
MNFFEQELRKIVSPYYSDATYVGRACYVRLNDMNRAKINFTTLGIADHYEALRMMILNRNDGKVDTLLVRFEDLFGKKQVNNPYFPDGVYPHILDNYGKADWYVYHPDLSDYESLGEAVSTYLSVYQEQTQESSPGWGQTM